MMSMGEERLIDVLSKSVYKTADQIRDNIVRSVHEFSEGTQQFDDLTVVVVKIN